MQHGLLAAELLNAFMYTNICHCSPVTNLVKWRPPEQPSTYSDFKDGFGIGLAINDNYRKFQ